jgi:hypothetical protein
LYRRFVSETDLSLGFSSLSDAFIRNLILASKSTTTSHAYQTFQFALAMQYQFGHLSFRRNNQTSRILFFVGYCFADVSFVIRNNTVPSHSAEF